MHWLLEERPRRAVCRVLATARNMLGPGGKAVIIPASAAGDTSSTRCFPAAWRKMADAGFVTVLGLSSGVLVGAAPPSSTPESVTLRGKVMTLADALESRDLGLKADPEPIAKQVVLLAEDGAITPLLSDDASRALFLDERLRNCPAEIQGRRFANVALSPGRLFPGRAGRSASNSRVLLRRLCDQRSLPTDLPLLSGSDGATHEARSSLIGSKRTSGQTTDRVSARLSWNGCSTSDWSFSSCTAADRTAEGDSSACRPPKSPISCSVWWRSWP